MLVRADIPLSSVLFPVCGTLTDVQPAAAAAGAAMASPASTDNAVAAAPASAHRL